jgi:hypothetical protein
MWFSSLEGMEFLYITASITLGSDFWGIFPYHLSLVGTGKVGG